jgi:hypothetical protein
VAQIYPQALGSLSVASYDSQGYGGGILIRLHTNNPCQKSKSKSKSKLYYYRQSVGQSVLVSGTHLEPATNFSFSLKFSLDSCGFVILQLPLWREDGFVIYCFCWFSPAQSRGTQDDVLFSQLLRLPQPGVPGPCIYIPQEQGGPYISPGTGFSFRRLLRLAVLRWRYSTSLHTDNPCHIATAM